MAMSTHVLITYATRRPFREVPSLPGAAQYDRTQGMWIMDGEPLVTIDGQGIRATKKCDQETGEDQKGE